MWWPSISGGVNRADGVRLRRVCSANMRVAARAGERSSIALAVTASAELRVVVGAAGLAIPVTTEPSFAPARPYGGLAQNSNGPTEKGRESILGVALQGPVSDA